MRTDLKVVLKNFCVENGRLMRRLATGHTKAVTVVERGRLVAKVAGEKYFGPDIAWSCHYLVSPLYPVLALDGDPFNLAPGNLMPVRVKRLRYRVYPVHGGFSHSRSFKTFKTAEIAREDWLMSARAYYLHDKAYVRRVEDETQPACKREELLELVTTVKRVRKVYPKSAPREGRPEAVEGRVWHWWKDSWISLPEPCHESDDWMVRAAVVAENPPARFVYDPVAERTVSVV